MNSIDETLDLLENSNNSILDNAKNLFDDIKNLNDKVKSSSSDTYKNIDLSLNSLKDFLDDKNYQIENNELLRETKELELNTSYYKTIVDMKNDLFNYSLKSSDELIDSFDNFINNKNELTNKYLNLFNLIFDNNNNLNLHIIDLTKKSNDNIINIISNTSTNYKIALNKYLTSSDNIISSFINKYDAYKNEIIKDKNELSDNLKIIFENSNIFNNGEYSDILSILNKKFLKYYDFYKSSVNKELEKLDATYNKESKIIKKHINKLVKDNLNNLKVNESLDIESTINNDEIIRKYASLIEITPEISLSEYLFTTINEKRINNYIKDKQEIVNKYKSIFNEFENKQELFKFINNQDKYLLFLENKDLTEKLLSLYNNLYFKFINKRTNSLNSLFVDEINSIKELESLKALFIKDLNEIQINFNNNISNEINVYKNNVNNSLCKYNSLINSSYNEIDYYDNFNSKLNNLLNYKIESSSINTKYIIEKSNLKLSYDLSKIEKDLSLIKPNFELKKLIDSYESLKKTYETIYNSEKELLEKSKERNELLDLSNYRYAHSFIKNKTLISKEMIELAEKEYEIRLNILNSVLSSSKKFNKQQIDNINKIYLDKIDSLNNLKDIEIKSILDELDNKNIKEIDTIKNKYIKLQNDIEYHILNDPNIIYEKENIEIINESILEGIEKAGDLKEKTLKVTNDSLMKAKNNFDAIIDSLNNEPIDYNSSLESYSNTFIKCMNRINEKFNIESKPINEKIQRINDSYSLNEFYKKYNELDSKHKKELNTLKDVYLSNYQLLSCDNENNITEFNYEFIENNINNDNNSKINEIYKNQLKDIQDKYKNSLKEHKEMIAKDGKLISSNLNKLNRYNKNNIKLLKKVLTKYKQKRS